MKKLGFLLLACLLFTGMSDLFAQQGRNADILPYPESGDVVSVMSFGAKGDGVTDDTHAFQKALDSFGTKGGTVYAPRGVYMFKGNLNIPAGVTLKGAFESVPSHIGLRWTNNPQAARPGDHGTTFLVTANRGTENAEPFITLNTNSTFRGVLMFWPDQKIQEIPAPYPWGIVMRGNNPAILDIEMLNPYNAIDASKNVRALIRNIHGQPLRRGVYVDGILDIGRIENVHWNPWWCMSGALWDWQLENGEAFIFERTDWHYVVNTFCYGYKVGYKFGASQSMSGSCNGNFLGIGADGCNIAVLVEQSAPFGLLITNGEFVAMFGEDPTMVEVKDSNKGNIRFVNCAFWGPCDQIVRTAGTGTVGFADCTFLEWDRQKKGTPAIQANGGNLIVRGSEFWRDMPHISISDKVNKAIVSDNIFKGKVQIENKAENTSIYGNLGD